MTVKKRKSRNTSWTTVRRDSQATQTKQSKAVIKGWNAVKQTIEKIDPEQLEQEFCIFLEDIPKVSSALLSSLVSR